MNPKRCFLLVLSFACLATSSQAQRTAEQFRLATDAKSALYDLQYDKAAEAAEQLAESTKDHEFQLVAADTLLRCGRSERALELFDSYLVSRPGDKPYLWQRGIALYFEGDFDKGVEQFEIHREVNPNDVENAAWHFLCVAKQKSTDAAKKLLLPAPNDSRAPMKEVLEMLNTGDAAPVINRMNSFADKTGTKKSAQFYGNFYLGLYADAFGRNKDAVEYLDAAIKVAPRNYMGDIAKVYGRHLNQR